MSNIYIFNLRKKERNWKIFNEFNATLIIDWKIFVITYHYKKKPILQQKWTLVAIWTNLLCEPFFCCNKDLKVLIYCINMLFVAITCNNFVAID